MMMMTIAGDVVDVVGEDGGVPAPDVDVILVTVLLGSTLPHSAAMWCVSTFVHVDITWRKVNINWFTLSNIIHTRDHTHQTTYIH